MWNYSIEIPWDLAKWFESRSFSVWKAVELFMNDVLSWNLICKDWHWIESSKECIPSYVVSEYNEAVQQFWSSDRKVHYPIKRLLESIITRHTYTHKNWFVYPIFYPFDEKDNEKFKNEWWISQECMNGFRKDEEDIFFVLADMKNQYSNLKKVLALPIKR